MSKVFFTADTHFDHANILKYCGRPFKDVHEMNEELIKRWNAKVGKDDVVYHLGDVTFGGVLNLDAIIQRLNFGYMHVIKGNHDYNFAKWYREAQPKNVHLYNSYLETKIDGQEFTLCHYALRVFNKSHHGAYHLYGHSHGTLPDDPNSRSFDVGVDCHNYEPISLAEVHAIMATKEIKPVDHHGKKADS